MPNDMQEVEETEDQDILDTREQIDELLKIPARTPEQETELKDLKKKWQGTYNKRIGQVYGQKKEAERRAEAAEKRAEEAEQRARELEDSRTNSAPEVSAGGYPKTKISGKDFYTDEALENLVADRKMSQGDAWKHQQTRIKEETKEELRQENAQQENERIRQQCIDDVLREYPHFDPKHPKHNKEDPLYKEASRILSNGYAGNPRGIKLAIEDAKRLIGDNNRRPDLSDELGVNRNEASVETRLERKRNEVILSEEEKDAAYRLYVMGSKINPETNKVYTRQEAITKALKAKQSREAMRTNR